MPRAFHALTSKPSKQKVELHRRNNQDSINMMMDLQQENSTNISSWLETAEQKQLSTFDARRGTVVGAPTYDTKGQG